MLNGGKKLDVNLKSSHSSFISYVHTIEVDFEYIYFVASTELIAFSSNCVNISKKSKKKKHAI